jgi:hypothetical protein
MSLTSTTTRNPQDVTKITNKTDDGIVRMVEQEEVPMGSFCTELDEAVPTYERAPCEKVWKNKNSAYIVLGRDRPASFASGWGGKGATGAGSVDIVVGRLSGAKSILGFASKNKETVTGPNFGADAARIYVSQKTDIDKNFGLPDAVSIKRNEIAEKLVNKVSGKPISQAVQIVPSSVRSGIGIKSDHTRIIGRQDVKIYAGKMDGWTGFGVNGEPNSAGGVIDNTQCHIYLMAGGSNVQPIVLGNNLKRYLLKKELDNRRLLSDIVKISFQLAQIVATLSPVLGPKAGELMKDNIEGGINNILGAFNSKIDELNFFGMSLGEIGTLTTEADEILSKHVFST